MPHTGVTGYDNAMAERDTKKLKPVKTSRVFILQKTRKETTQWQKTTIS